MYKKEIKLNNNEIAAKINVLTGEVIEVKNVVSNIPEDKEKFSYDKSFHKSYEKSWEYLLDNLTGIELKIALKMANMTEFHTNSLAPLDGTEDIRELADFFNVSKSSIKKALDNLFYHGVYAAFTYQHYKRGKVNEWVFNPFISFKGTLIGSDLKNLFISTRVAKYFLQK